MPELTKEQEEQIFKALLQELGYREPHERHKLLTNPPNLQTMSRLKGNQIMGQALAHTMQKGYGLPYFVHYYDNLASSMISQKGYGREEVINFEKASKPTEGTGIGIFTSQSQKEATKKKRFWNRGKKEEEE